MQCEGCDRREPVDLILDFEGIVEGLTISVKTKALRCPKCGSISFTGTQLGVAALETPILPLKLLDS